MLCRKASYAAAEEIIRLSNESEDDRVLYQYAWGKPKDFDSKSEKIEEEDHFNPHDYMLEQLDLIVGFREATLHTRFLASVRNRRNPVVAARSGEGPFTIPLRSLLISSAAP
jgi:hypothetical protein